MIELYKEWRQRAQGVKEVEEYIDAEYSLLDEKPPPKPGGKSGGKTAAKVAKKVDEKSTSKKVSGPEGKFGAEAEEEEAATESQKRSGAPAAKDITEDDVPMSFLSSGHDPFTPKSKCSV
ncbi:unnamed protein product [marine sediment metagenome]|uniref:Uncharacterized protein n=1 Tax=marine sediment metagenome TaxID=412755 RepID=X1RJU0_9ZZZZ